MLTYSLADRWHKVRAVNETSNGYRSIIPTGTEPVTAGTATATSKSVQEICTDILSPGKVRSTVEMLFYGTGANNNTFLARCLSWTCTDGAPATRLWVPTTLFEATLTLSSTVPGVAGKDLVAAELFADTIVIVGTSGNANVTFSITSPADNTIAHLSMSIEGSQKLEWIFTTGGSATDCNALWRTL